MTKIHVASPLVGCVDRRAVVQQQAAGAGSCGWRGRVIGAVAAVPGGVVLCGGTPL